ncbi:hypothetical protein B0H16DRAFT_942735 [Mycena metata]|uniref:Uncharacterized protein n=1 Tax=Mycena metata TaxID=1033252 RepID=A0AAD7IMI4_9AGAR|nr:hypothetical protein B0H16DRAFT_942735 [Mycena metata]
MTSSRTPALEHADFKALSSSIQDAMVSWHNTASLTSPAQLRPSLLALAKSLHVHWANILEFLQNCYNFGQIAIEWKNSLEQGSDLDPVSWLEDLVPLSDALCLQTEALVQQADTNIASLSSLTPQLTNLLRVSSKFNPAASPVTATFLGVSSPPDGATALASTAKALAAIRTSLCSFHRYWTTVSETCRTPNAILIRAEDIHKLGKTWEAYKEEIHQAKSSVARSQDAVLTAVPTEKTAPPPRRQPRRRGSSKSEASFSSSRFSLPRRTSSLDDDEVPNCWGFGTFSKKR